MEQDRNTNLPATVTGQSPTSLAESKLTELRNLPERIDDQTLARLDALANSPLRPLAPIDRGDLDEQLLLLLSTLPKQAAGGVDGALKAEGYAMVLGKFPRPQIEFMVTEAIRTCRWLPSPAECIAIAGKWQRFDAAVESRHLAKCLSRREREARMDDADAALRAGTMDQATIDALPERWREIFETRSLLRKHADGTYTLRARPAPPVSEDETVHDIARQTAARFPSHRDLGEAA